MTIHVHIHTDETDSRLNRMETLLNQILKGQQEMDTALDTKIQAVKDALTAETEVDKAIIVFIKSVPQLILDAVNAAKAQGATAAQLQSLTDVAAAIKTNTQEFADALLAGTGVTTPTEPGLGDPPPVTA